MPQAGVLEPRGLRDVQRFDVLLEPVVRVGDESGCVDTGDDGGSNAPTSAAQAAPGAAAAGAPAAVGGTPKAATVSSAAPQPSQEQPVPVRSFPLAPTPTNTPVDMAAGEAGGPSAAADVTMAGVAAALGKTGMGGGGGMGEGTAAEEGVAGVGGVAATEGGPVPTAEGKEMEKGEVTQTEGGEEAVAGSGSGPGTASGPGATRPAARLITVARKHLPDTHTHERLFAYVSAVGGSVGEVVEGLVEGTGGGPAPAQHAGVPQLEEMCVGRCAQAGVESDLC